MIVHYDPAVISLKILITIHLHTHAATKKHCFREKYRSAVYVFDDSTAAVQSILQDQQGDFRAPIITEVLSFAAFKGNTENYLDYFRKNKEGAFCQTYILPKLKILERDYAAYFQEGPESDSEAP